VAYLGFYTFCVGASAWSAALSLCFLLGCYEEEWYAPCKTTPKNSNSGNNRVGMGAAPPAGGSGCGNASASSADAHIGMLGPPQEVFFDQTPGRIIVKVFSQGFNMPFSGATDAGGYFYIPLIPEDEPFTATAIDTLTGQTRTSRAPARPWVNRSSCSSTSSAKKRPAHHPVGRRRGWQLVGRSLNWDTDLVPGPSDRVLIDVPGRSRSHMPLAQLLSKTWSAKRRWSCPVACSPLQRIRRLTTTLPSHRRVRGLRGSGGLTVNGLLTWSKGTMGGTGVTLANGGLVIDGDQDKFLSGRTLSNAANATGVAREESGPLAEVGARSLICLAPPSRSRMTRFSVEEAISGPSPTMAPLSRPVAWV